jgi:hypothetical protein
VSQNEPKPVGQFVSSEQLREADRSTSAFAAAADASAAEWVVGSVRDFDFTVGSIIPDDFAAYARVFHPAALGPWHQLVEVRWAEVAAANGRMMHPAVEWGSITGSWKYQYNDEQPGIWTESPQTGSLSPEQARRLVAVLARHTGTPESCWFGVWEGKGELHRALFAAARFEVPQRPMWLLHGPIQAAASSPYPGGDGDSVNLWWPEDRAWCVGTEIDLMTTYVGGTQECIDAVLSETSLEAMPVAVDQYVTWDADTINPLPASPYSDDS